ncbi:N-acetyltransferase family protein [Actinomycetota bacterium Odt1-20B]
MPERERGLVSAAAWRTLCHPDQLPQQLRAMLGNADVSWHPPRPATPAHTPVGSGPQGLRLRDPAGGFLTAHRWADRITTTQRFAAHLLALLSRRPTLPRTHRRRVRLADGTPLALRLATPRDLPKVAALHALCAPLSQPEPYRIPCRAELPHLLHPRVGRSLLAEAPGRRPVGWASLAWDGLGADVLLLAAEAWQDRGVLTVLLAALVDEARESGCRMLWVQASPGAAVDRAVRAIGPHCSVEPGTDATAVTLTLTNPPEAGRPPGPRSLAPHRAPGFRNT